MPLTYGDYLQLPALLSLQRPLSEGPEHDETLFIVIHQVYELWFKQVLHELDHLRAKLLDGEIPRTRHALRRVLTILKTLVSQVDVLETMTPLSFLSFRARLEAASGFQSVQFREVEFALGHRGAERLAGLAVDDEGRARLEARMAQPSVWRAFLALLERSVGGVPEAALAASFEAPTKADPAVQALLLTVYREHDELAQIAELLVDLDEGLQEWRYRHVKMVERTIGSRGGTGGSEGAAYLASTLFRPVFPDLWAIRARL